MARKRSQSSHWLNNRWWILTIGEWIGLTLAFLSIVVVFCLLFIRRHSIDYHLQHTFAVHDPEFVGSAVALGDPTLLEGNKLEPLENGDAFFPAMFDAIRNAKRAVNFECYIVESDDTGRQLRDVLCERARAGVQVRVLLDGVGSGWGLDNSDVRSSPDHGQLARGVTTSRSPFILVTPRSAALMTRLSHRDIAVPPCTGRDRNCTDHRMSQL